MTTKKHLLIENLIPASREQIRAMKGIIVSTDNGWKVAHSHIIGDPKLNKRIDYGDIPELAESILVNGILVPLKGSFVVDRTDKKGVVYFLLTDGFRRDRGITYLESLGKEVGLVPCQANDKSISNEDRIYQMFVTQDNKKLTDLEIAEVFKELVNLGIPTKTIALRVAKTETYVKDMIELSKQTSHVKNAISKGQTTPTAVNKISKKLGPEAAQRAVYDAASMNRKLTVNDATEAVKDQTSKRSAIDYDTIPGDLEGMIKLREVLISLKTRTKDQLHTINTLDAKIKIRQDALATSDVKEPSFPVEFDTKLETEFKSIFCPAIGMDLCGDIYTWFESRFRK